MGACDLKKVRGVTWNRLFEGPRENPNGVGYIFKNEVSIVHITARSATRDDVVQKGVTPYGGVEV